MVNPYNIWKCHECDASTYTDRTCSDWLENELMALPNVRDLDDGEIQFVCGL